MDDGEVSGCEELGEVGYEVTMEPGNFISTLGDSNIEEGGRSAGAKGELEVVAGERGGVLSAGGALVVELYGSVGDSFAGVPGDFFSATGAGELAPDVVVLKRFVEQEGSTAERAK